MALRSRKLARGRRTPQRGRRVPPRVRELPFHEPRRCQPPLQRGKRCRPRVHRGGGWLSGHSLWGGRSVRSCGSAGLPRANRLASETRSHYLRFFLNEEANAAPEHQQRAQTRKYLYSRAAWKGSSRKLRHRAFTATPLARYSAEGCAGLCFVPLCIYVSGSLPESVGGRR